MESDPSHYGIIILLLLSAYFSASETAFFSLGKLHLKKIESETGKASRRIIRLLKKPQELLITILLGNTVVNVAASTWQRSMYLIMFKQFGGLIVRLFG